jgi:putative transposase
MGELAGFRFGHLREVPVSWQESSPMSERLRFIQACVDRRERIVDICRRFGISEKTGHKWLVRFRDAGEGGLLDRSHAPLHRADLVQAAIAERVVRLRRQHPLYGAGKLHDWLLQNEPGTRWPAASTIGELLRRAGLIHRRRRRSTAGAAQRRGHRIPATAPNVVWTADFKGEFLLGSAHYCYPLTVLDLHSHFLLGCRALPSTAIDGSQLVFRRLFREYGLPAVMRTDNGVPFAQPNATGRFGRLAFWWVRLGIRPDFIQPGRPAENGAHERFHRTLKAHTARPPAASASGQQKRFDRFRAEYNEERPHEDTVARRPPAASYHASARPFPEKLPPLWYPGSTAVRLVDSSGYIKWQNSRFFVSSNLAHELVGVTESDTDQLELRYAQLLIGSYDLHTQRFTARFEWEQQPTP